MSGAMTLSELDEIVFGARPRGRPSGDPLELEFVRDLGEADCDAIVNDKPLQAGPKITVGTMRARHHQIAQLVAQGRQNVDIALIVGCSPQHVCNLKQGQDFQELVRHYESQRDAVFVDAMERLKATGLVAQERLVEALEDQEEQWTKRELMEAVELCLVKPTSGGRKGDEAQNATGVTVNVQFVGAEDTGRPVITGEVIGEVVKPRQQLNVLSGAAQTRTFGDDVEVFK